MEPLPEAQDRRLVIAIDYGTTYTGTAGLENVGRHVWNYQLIFYIGVAYATPAGDRAILDEINVVQDWGPDIGNHMKIPSIISYSPRSQANEKQWGSDLSPQAIAMVHTKLQLDVGNTSSELDLILDMLDGLRDLSFPNIINRGTNRYPTQRPEDIIKHYLTKVFDHLFNAVVPFAAPLGTLLPVDIVVTVPVVSLPRHTS